VALSDGCAHCRPLRTYREPEGDVLDVTAWDGETETSFVGFEYNGSFGTQIGCSDVKIGF